MAERNAIKTPDSLSNKSLLIDKVDHRIINFVTGDMMDDSVEYLYIPTGITLTESSTNYLIILRKLRLKIVSI